MAAGMAEAMVPWWQGWQWWWRGCSSGDGSDGGEGAVAAEMVKVVGMEQWWQGWQWRFQLQQQDHRHGIVSVTMWHLGGDHCHHDGGHSGGNGEGDGDGDGDGDGNSNSSRDGDMKGCMANAGQSMTGQGYAGTLNNAGASTTDEQFAYRAVRRGKWGMCLAH